MLSSDEVILEHAKAPYDPVKRREYYLRTRKLKGRRVGDAPDKKEPPAKGEKTLPARTPGKSVTSSQIRRNKHRTLTEVRVAALKVRLEKLRGTLKQLIRQAQIRSGATLVPMHRVPTKQPNAAGPNRTQDTSPQTARERKESAKRSKEYYENNRPNSAKDSKPSPRQVENQLKAEIEKVRTQVERARASLQASVDRGR
jgi:hypothetical protein